MRDREDFDRILGETLSAGWAEALGRPVRVETGGVSGQAWRFEPLLSAYFVAGVGPAARRFLRETFQFTTVRWRLPAQWMLARLLTSTIGLRLAGRPGFTVEPALPRAEALVVIPGNQRLRVFDLDRRLSRVFLKAGFDPVALRTEIAVRGSGDAGPWVPITASGLTWFEEPIFEGFALPRCPPWYARKALAASALAKLDAWLDRSERQVAGRAHAEALVARLVCSLRALPLGPEGRQALTAAAERLHGLVAGLDVVPVAVGHGDLQPGNVLVSRDGDEVTIIDWEHSAERWRHYDRLTWALSARAGAGLASRLLDLVQGASPAGAPALPADRDLRQRMAALFLLEDLAWFANESHAGPYRRISGGLAARLAELPRLLHAVGAKA